MLSKKQEDFVLAPFRHTLDVAEGTPRSGKTTACVLRYFLFLNLSPDTNHLIVGATQTQAFRLAMDSDGNGRRRKGGKGHCGLAGRGFAL